MRTSTKEKSRAKSTMLDRCKIPGENFGKLIQYRNLDLSAPGGIEQAEKLKEDGWKIARSGLFLIQYFRYVKG